MSDKKYNKNGNFILLEIHVGSQVKDNNYRAAEREENKTISIKNQIKVKN